MIRVLYVQLPPARFACEEVPTNVQLAPGFLASASGAGGAEDIRVEILESDVVDVFADEGLAAEICRRQPDVVGLTLYLWNVKRSLFLASNIKRRRPETRILAGGPEVTPDNEWVLNHPALDAGVFGEGESRVRALLEVLSGRRDMGAVPGTFFKDSRGLNLNLDPVPPWDLSACPYPYLNRAIGPSRDGIIFVETVRGCPFRCRYCYYHKAFDRVRRHPIEAVEGVLDWAYAANSGVREIYLMDPTFNAVPRFAEVLKGMAARRSSKEIAIHTELRADLLNADDVILLRDAGLKTAEVGLQTTNPVALRHAGRKGDPDRTASGVHLLKDAGIEVYTGIILGLPGDRPEGFSATLQWLKKSDAYSVLQPFVLSVLPGTDFRTQAAKLGLQYDPRPPYYIQQTGTFPQDALGDALAECERVFDVELDHVPLPSFVDEGVDVISQPEEAPYISKWIVDPRRCLRGHPRLLDSVISRATDPFVFWFRGENPRDWEGAMMDALKEFMLRNPHALLDVILEFSCPPRPEFPEAALSEIADPAAFVNRSFAPFRGDGTVVFPRFFIIFQDPLHSSHRQRIEEEYGHCCVPVWDTGRTRLSDVRDDVSPRLISWPVPDVADAGETLFPALEYLYQSPLDDVVFRDSRLHRAWTCRHRKRAAVATFPERILVTVDC